jgi:hypothetical protein
MFNIEVDDAPVANAGVPTREKPASKTVAEKASPAKRAPAARRKKTAPVREEG